MRSILVPAIAIAVASPATAQPSWQGRYVYDEAQGRDAVGQGAAIGVRHRLTLGPRGACRIDASGFQTDTHILCRATPRGRTIELAFRSYAGGGVTNQYGVQVYRVGQPLLTLRRDGGRLTTVFQGYAPDAGAKAGVYFRKE